MTLDTLSMSAPERLDRVAELLTVALLRLALRREKKLACPRPPQAACALAADVNANPPRKESVNL